MNTYVCNKGQKDLFHIAELPVKKGGTNTVIEILGATKK